MVLWLLLVGGGNGAWAKTPAYVTAGQDAFQRGAFSQAAAQWESALEEFRRDDNASAEVVTSVSLARAYQALGQHRRAVELLEAALPRAEAASQRRLMTLIKHQLGAALTMGLDAERGAALLEEALASAQADQDRPTAAAILNDQGNLLATQQKSAPALAAFRESLILCRETGQSVLTAQVLCNAAATAIRARDLAQADIWNTEALQAIQPLAISYDKAFLLLRAAVTDQQLIGTQTNASARLLQRAHESFEAARQAGEKLNNPSIQTDAFGHLAQLYRLDGQADAALALTRRAIFTAQQAGLAETLYRWEWQLGRLFRERGEAANAVAAYRRAVQTLQPIRHDVALGYGNTLTASTFREGNGPLFFELADLLLEEAQPPTDPARGRQLLLEARDTVEQLKAVELEDYFQDDCVNVLRAKTQAVEAVDAHTAVVYVIPLANRTEVLVGLESGLRRFTSAVGAEQLSAQAREFRRNLETRTTYAYLAEARQLYDWLIRPIAPLLREKEIDTLVFVPDGALRSIPLASLHDGTRFLIQDFAVAVAPGLSLVEPRPIERGKARVLLNGLSESVQGFPRLDFVRGELERIEPLYRHDKLMDQTFTLEELQRKVEEEQYSIVHIASHGQFDRDVRKTFVLTYDSKLTLNQLESLIRPSQYRGRPVELLVLSACQTAAGDDRAALGLAGIAVKAGARSALATLWFVNDESTSVLVSEVYDQLRRTPAVSKARAVQAAQIKLLADRRYRHPCYWSPYLIIGNWL